MAISTESGSLDFLTIEWNLSPLILAEQFYELNYKIKSFREPLNRAIREVMIPSIKENFETGDDWEPLADFTVEKKGFDTILVETGALARKAGQVNTWTVTSEEAFVSNLSGAEYGYFHQSGYVNHWTGGEVPARPFLVITEENEQDIEEIFADWLDERLDRIGLL